MQKNRIIRGHLFDHIFDILNSQSVSEIEFNLISTLHISMNTDDVYEVRISLIDDLKNIDESIIK